jgi:hypothetical protein
MAIVQISRIQHRRGLQQDLPQLASGELGWSIDTRQLYIGNGTQEEGAPSEGVTEILTSQSNFLNFINTYTFKGTESGYTSTTGTTELSPVLRSLQSKLDDIVNVRDFGAIGNGVADDTTAIQRAILQTYVTGLSNTVSRLRRTIKIPAGTYLITSTILVPPGCTILGDGKHNTILSSSVGTVFQTADSKFQVGASLGTQSDPDLPLPQLPEYVSISKIQFSKSSNTTSAVVLLDSFNNILFEEVRFTCDSAATRLVEIATSASSCSSLTFDKCVFDGGIAGIGATGTLTGVKVLNSQFKSMSGVGIVTNTYIKGLVSAGNDFGTINPFTGLIGDNYSIGDTVDSLNSNSFNSGVVGGTAVQGPGYSIAVAGTTTVKSLGTGAGLIEYQLTNGTNYRFGTFKYSCTSSGAVSFEDEYNESTDSFLSANLFASASGTLTCQVSGPGTLKYNIKKFA